MFKLRLYSIIRLKDKIKEYLKHVECKIPLTWTQIITTDQKMILFENENLTKNYSIFVLYRFYHQ